MDDHSYTIDYTFSSGMLAIDELQYIRNVTAIVRDDDNQRKVCEVEFRIFSLSRAENDGFDLEQIFDHEANSYNYGELFFDYSHNCYKDILINAYPEIEMNGDLCIIDSIAIQEVYRKKGLGAKVFKDIVLSFDLSCHLFVLKPFPLQFSNCQPSEFVRNMDFKPFHTDEETARCKLVNYYKGWGFKPIDGVPDLLFFHSAYRNSFFDSINMNDD